MALVRSKLHSTMTDERLSALRLLSVESDLLDNYNVSLLTLLTHLRGKKAESVLELEVQLISWNKWQTTSSEVKNLLWLLSA